MNEVYFPQNGTERKCFFLEVDKKTLNESPIPMSNPQQPMKPKTHTFTVNVTSSRGDSITRQMAYMALLSCFGRRQPDGCAFLLNKTAPKKPKLTNQ
jgi:hypothetical protein